jgi:hypothetical protein
MSRFEPAGSPILKNKNHVNKLTEISVKGEFAETVVY